MAFSDSSTAVDGVSAGISTEVVTPHNPCPTCGKETNDRPVLDIDGRTVLQKRRICTGCKQFHNPDD